MCNIAGYAGKKQAAPILLEMLRREQAFDGYHSTGIATVHEGKLYYRKVVGNVDNLIRNTDALDLPGTIGIAHSRSAGNPDNPMDWYIAHPYINPEETIALVSNGTNPRDNHTPIRDAAAQKLADAGYKFHTELARPNSGWPRLKNGNTIATGEVRIGLVDYYHKQGMTYTQAMAQTATDLYTDNVLVSLAQDAPDEIVVTRTVRPMQALLGDGETYIATTAFAFPDDVAGQKLSLPLMRSCIIRRGTLEITNDLVQGDIVDPVTPKGYAIAYQAVLDYLKDATEENPLPGITAGFASRLDEIFPGKHTFNEKVRLGYEILEQLDAEDRLGKKEVLADFESAPFKRVRYRFWLK